MWEICFSLYIANFKSDAKQAFSNQKCVMLENNDQGFVVMQQKSLARSNNRENKLMSYNDKQYEHSRGMEDIIGNNI